jgi:hypothetical protein
MTNTNIATGDSQRSDSRLHVDGSHSILLILKGSRLVYIHPEHLDGAKKCPAHLWEDGAQQIDLDKFDAGHSKLGFVAFPVEPGDLISQSQGCAKNASCATGDIVFIERRRPHRIVANAGAVALSFTALCTDN